MVFPTGWNLRGLKTVKGAVPFPVLAKLTISGGYPFDDDTLFRGNSGTLHRLSISFDMITINALGGPGVLNRSGITQMSPIHTVQVTDVPGFRSPDNFVREQVHDILETSTTLQPSCDTIYGRTIDGQALNSLCDLLSTTVLQHLTLFNQRCDIGDVIRVVSALPSLVSLTTAIQESVKRTELISESEHPSTLHTMYYPASSNFRMLRVPSVETTEVDMVSIIAMQVAVVCPSLAHVDLPLEVHKEFRDKVTWSSENGIFKPYGDALRRLI
ncbi:hypothetical protein GGI17_005136 [Coemansia sp. S146]|nr:hypothetical protein GGI17_005136 [Coemansia sp. S146]